MRRVRRRLRLPCALRLGRADRSRGRRHYQRRRRGSLDRDHRHPYRVELVGVLELARLLALALARHARLVALAAHLAPLGIELQCGGHQGPPFSRWQRAWAGPPRPAHEFDLSAAVLRRPAAALTRQSARPGAWVR